MVKLGRSIPTQEGEEELDIFLTDEARQQGVYVIGTTGTGKTALLTNIVHQDMEHKDKPAVIVLDPHGDMIDELLTLVPASRKQDTILFSPADTKAKDGSDQYTYPLGLNVLEHTYGDPHERDLVSSNLISVLYKLFFNSWGPRMEDLLRNSVLTILEEKDKTLLDLWLLLVHVMGLNPRDELYKEKLPNPEDPYLWAFWHKQMARYSVTEKGEVISSSLNKLGRFLGNPVVRNIVAQPESGFSLPDIMDNGKILFCNMAKGVLGEDNSSLLGSVLINMVLIAALSRRNQDPATRKPVHLVVDEYQTFATESFPILQSEARKYGITITVAHQYRDQLDDLNKGSTMNCANFICLRVSGRDAEELATQFDNTPENPDTRLEAVPQHFRTMNGEETYVDFIQKGQTLKREVKQPRRMYSDVAGERANQLTILPNIQALVRLMDNNRLVEYHVHLDRVNRDISDQEKRNRQNIVTGIRARSKGRHKRDIIEARIKKKIQEIAPTLGYSDNPPPA